MTDFKKILTINLLVILAYSALFMLFSQEREGFIVYMILSMIGLIITVLVNLIKALNYYYNKDKPKGNVYLLNTLIVMLIGGSLCFGGAQVSQKIYEGNWSKSQDNGIESVEIIEIDSTSVE